MLSLAKNYKENNKILKYLQNSDRNHVYTSIISLLPTASNIQCQYNSMMIDLEGWKNIFISSLASEHWYPSIYHWSPYSPAIAVNRSSNGLLLTILEVPDHFLAPLQQPLCVLGLLKSWRFIVLLPEVPTSPLRSFFFASRVFLPVICQSVTLKVYVSCTDVCVKCRD